MQRENVGEREVPHWHVQFRCGDGLGDRGADAAAYHAVFVDNYQVGLRGLVDHAGRHWNDPPGVHHGCADPIRPHRRGNIQRILCESADSDNEHVEVVGPFLSGAGEDIHAAFQPLHGVDVWAGCALGEAYDCRAVVNRDRFRELLA